MARLPGRAALAGLQSGAPVRAGPRLLLNIALRLERRLPLPGTVEVHVGQQVDAGSVIATAPNTPSRLHVIDIAKAMDQPGHLEDLRITIDVAPGQPVFAGEVVARAPRPGWVEREELHATSPVSGIVEFVSQPRGQVVVRANAEITEDRIALPVANFLSIDASELPGVVVCRPGQEVAPGDLLAKTTGFRPLGTEYRSSVGGIVESISHLSGVITIVRKRRPLVLRATMQGWVERVYPGYGATIAAQGHRVLGVLGLGGKSWGQLICLSQPPAAGPEIEQFAGTVLAFPGRVDEPTLSACRSHGVRGVIAASTGARDLERFLGRPLAAEIVTGPGTLSLGADDDPGRDHSLAADDDGPPGMAVIITEGFGKLPMDEMTWQALQGHAGRVVSLDGLTQIRAGVVRPSVLLPTGQLPRGQETDQADAGDAAGTAAPPGGGEAPGTLAVGQRVRIVRHPHFGHYGTVVQPPGGLTRLETEVEARVMVIQLDDGRRVKVAEANIEY